MPNQPDRSNNQNKDQQTILMRIVRPILFVMAATSAGFAHAQEAPENAYSLEAYVSSEAIQAQYIREMSVSEIGKAEFGAGVFFNEDRDLIGMGTALAVIGAPDSLTRFIIRAGTRLYGAFLNGEDEDVFGISVGGDARYLLGRNRGNSIVLSLFYAPDILVFGSADGVRDASLRFETGLQGNTTIFVGYRSLQFDLPVSRKVDDSVHIGARHEF